MPKEEKSPKELACLTFSTAKDEIDEILSRSRSWQGFDPATYSGRDEKYNALFKTLKHGLVFKFDVKEFLKELYLLDSSYQKIVDELAPEFPEFFQPEYFI